MADLKIFARTIEPEAMAQIEQMAERLHHRHHHDHP